MVRYFIFIAAVLFGDLSLSYAQKSGSLNNTSNNNGLNGPWNRAKGDSALVTYAEPTNLETSPIFSVQVNGTDIWTEQAGGGTMEGLNVANFSCAGAQTIKVTVSSNITSCVIRPKSRGIVAKVKGRTITFKIPGPQKLYLEINDLPHLAIFADPLEINPPKPGDDKVIYYGPGFYNVDNLSLKSDETLYIAGGAVVNANLQGNNIQNVRILGRGILNGSIRISNATNLEVGGIFIRHNSGGWVNTLTDCTHGIYRNVKVFSYLARWGTDGIDPVSCRDFTIDDCFVRTRDDCISIKSSREGHPTEGITVKNCVMVGWAHADGITLGFELNGLVTNVQVTNCDILYARGQGHTGGHSAFSIVCDDHGDVKNVRFEDIRVEENIEIKNLEFIVTEAQRYGQSNPRPGHVNGVYLKNVQWENPDKPFVIAGLPTMRNYNNNVVEDVTFDHCRVAGRLLGNLSDADFQIEFARNVKFIPSTQMKKGILSKE